MSAMEKQDVNMTSLQSQLDALAAQAYDQLPGTLLRQLQLPIEQLMASEAVSKALKVGERVSDFTLPDALGNLVTFSTLLQRGPVVVSFYRGAWCPYCNLQLRAYQQALPQIQELGASLVAISPQTADHSLSLMEKQELTFTVLSDVGNRVARQFGLVFTLDESVRAAHKQVGMDLPVYNGDESWELPMPGTFVIDQSGIACLAFVDPNFTQRLEPSTIIAKLEKLRPVQASKVIK
ncbi:peroxiredoxin-like family protein [Ktedonospora formicarum]|uniref:thioredoxin-dependent peroxiredoxin n=1 Tax=Ktedonospora formicarum TaxID=2778364 RepID=A0A8J3HZR4_9CHLR|nr:peroxiredoxin-like family protein [Ktedonospora formicarum]GHO46709.1 alkyl hydroperoxide reductase [Ktedonospora formicarum]